MRAVDTVAVQALINEFNADQRLNVDAITEEKYYDAQMMSAAPHAIPGHVCRDHHGCRQLFRGDEHDVCQCGAASAGSGYVASARFLARRAFLTSFFLESLLLSAIGGMIGCMLVLPLNNISTGSATSSPLARPRSASGHAVHHGDGRPVRGRPWRLWRHLPGPDGGAQGNPERLREI